MSFQIPIVLLAAHFVGDFIFQSDWMATNKSKSWKALALHVLVYSAVIAGVFNWSYFLRGDHFVLSQIAVGKWFALTFISHFVTDAITSRINARLWQANERHWFFVGIGADQLIHAVTLALTFQIVR